MNRFIFFKILLSFAFLLITPKMVYAELENEKEENLRGFSAKSEIKTGLILRAGFPFLPASQNVSFLPPLTLDIYGESFLHGSTGISLNWLSSVRKFVPLEAGKTIFSDVGPQNSGFLNKNLLIVSLRSPINYQAGDLTEYGWIGGVFSQFVSLNTPISGDSNSNIGINLGSYLKTYNLYPFVPFADLQLILGNLYDNGKTYQNNTLSSNVKAGYFLHFGSDFYLLKRLIFNFSYSLLNPDFFTFYPTRANPVEAGQSNNQPADDPYFSFAENISTLNFSFGFLF